MQRGPHSCRPAQLPHLPACDTDIAASSAFFLTSAPHLPHHNMPVATATQTPIGPFDMTGDQLAEPGSERVSVQTKLGEVVGGRTRNGAQVFLSESCQALMLISRRAVWS